MTDDVQILEAVERYISGQMSPDERVWFEGLRKSNPDIDQMVVEHTFFLQQIARFEDSRKMKSLLSETHLHLAEKGLIHSPRLQGKARVVYLYNRYKRVAMMAASIAGITALTISALVWSFSPGEMQKEEVTKLRREIDAKVNTLQKNDQALNQKIETVKEQALPASPPIAYTSGGTGFLFDTKGYLITSEHIVHGARNVAVQNKEGKDLTAKVIWSDPSRDIAILKITDSRFDAPSSIPFGFKKSGGEISEPIFTLGFPRNDIVYGEGYLSARTGHRGDTLTCQITVPANQGNSGSPILNRNGEVIGLLTGKLGKAEGAVYATHSKYILAAINDLQKDSAHSKIKITTSSTLKGTDRVQQVKKVTDYVYMVKVD